MGVLGRPENDGTTDVWYTIVRTGSDAEQWTGGGRQKAVGSRQEGGSVARSGDENNALRYEVEFVPVRYDHRRLASEMRGENLPEEFIETILTGWWTTCLEVLPAKERRRGRF